MKNNKKDINFMPLIDDRRFYQWSRGERKFKYMKLSDTYKINTTDDHMMVSQSLRIPNDIPIAENVRRKQGIKRHTANQKKRLKELKSFHKEYGQCLNNSTTKSELTKAIVKSMENEIKFNFVLTGNFKC